MHKAKQQLFLMLTLLSITGSGALDAVWWNPLTWFRTEAPVKPPQKIESTATLPAKQKNYLRNTKELSKGILPIAALTWALFFMPDSVRARMPKDLVPLLNDPKVLCPLYFAAGCNLAWKAAQVRNNLLNAKDFDEVGTNLVGSGINKAVASEQTQKNLKQVLKDSVYELLTEHPELIAKIMQHLNLIKIGGGSDIDSKELAKRLTELFMGATTGRHDEILKGLTGLAKMGVDQNKLQEERHKQILAALAGLKPFDVRIYEKLEQLANRVKNLPLRKFLGGNADFEHRVGAHLYGDYFGPHLVKSCEDQLKEVKE